MVLGRGVEEIGLVARGVGGAVQFRARRPLDAANIMAGGKAIRAQLARHVQQIGELGTHVAADAGHRRAPGEVIVGEGFDHFLAKRAFVVVDVMRDAQSFGDRARILDIVAGAARALASGGGAIIIELQRDADHFGARARSQRGDDRAVDAARHGDDDAAFGCRSRQVEQCGSLVRR